MNKYETMSYYDALGDGDSLICIDSSDDIDIIETKIEDCIAGCNRTTFHIETFHNEMGVQSYTLMSQDVHDTSSLDLWLDKSKQLEKTSAAEIAKRIAENMPKIAKSPYLRYVADKNVKNNTAHYVIKSFADENYSETMTEKALIKYASEMPENNKILGIFNIGNKVEIHLCNNEDTSDFAEIINKINDESIRLYANVCLKILPAYVFSAFASNNSKERPASDLNEGGLKRHLINTAKILCHMTELRYAHIKFTQNEIDMMIVAALFHDFLKNGWQEEYELDHDEKFEHPRTAAKALRCITGIIPDGSIRFITNCIESHMGDRCTDPNNPNCNPLPVPDTEFKYMIRLADHLATRKDIAFVQEDTAYVFASQKICTVKNFMPLSNSDKNIIASAYDMPVNMELAAELNIERNETDIKVLWAHMMDTKRATEKQLKYVELAKRTVFN